MRRNCPGSVAGWGWCERVLPVLSGAKRMTRIDGDCLALARRGYVRLLCQRACASKVAAAVNRLGRLFAAMGRAVNFIRPSAGGGRWCGAVSSRTALRPHLEVTGNISLKNMKIPETGRKSTRCSCIHRSRRPHWHCIVCGDGSPQLALNDYFQRLLVSFKPAG